MNEPISINPPTRLRQQFERLAASRDVLREMRQDHEQKLAQVVEFLNVSGQVTEALEKLSQDLLGNLADAVETQLTYALREVLEQPIALKVNREVVNGALSLEFEVERDGQREDILRGQGGSVANILSVGLRLFALTTLSEKEHRRFVVLDEQDCWLRPDLVPRLVKIIHEAGAALGFQVLLISHHDVAAFEQFADRIYRFAPGPDGVMVKLVYNGPAVADSAG